MPKCKVDETIDEGSPHVGDKTLEVWSTPGHGGPALVPDGSPALLRR